MCGEKIDSDLLECPHCGEKQYGENNEFYPDEKAMREAKAILQGQQSVESKGFWSRRFGKKQTQPIFSKEECFLYGIHPDDEMYCMKTQVFKDGNKRASVIFANHYLIAQGMGFLVIPEKEVPEFKKLLVQYYEGALLEVIGSLLKEQCWRNF